MTPAVSRSAETLEDRALLANLILTDARLIDDFGDPVGTPGIGEQIRVAAVFDTDDLAAGASYQISYAVDGVEIFRDNITDGAGLTSGTNFLRSKNGWYAEPGTHTVVVTLDSGGAIAEDSEADNSMTFTFTPVTANRQCS